MLTLPPNRGVASGGTGPPKLLILLGKETGCKLNGFGTVLAVEKNLGDFSPGKFISVLAILPYNFFFQSG